MSSLLTWGINWVTSLFDARSFYKGTSYTQKLKNEGLLEETPNAFILHDTGLDKYVYFKGANREQELASYLSGITVVDVEKNDKTMTVAISAIMAIGQIIAPMMIAAEKMHLFERMRSLANLPDVSCKAGLLAGSLCLVTGNSKEACVGLLALSYLRPAFAEVTVIKPVIDQVAYPTQKFVLNLRTSNVFSESDPSLSLSVVAKQSDGNALPDWLTFNITPSISGTIATYCAVGVYVVSNIAYVADDTGGLKLIDVSNPQTPSLVGSIDISGANAVYVTSNIAYVTTEGGSLQLIDVSNPRHPTSLIAITTLNAYGVYVVSNMAYVAAGGSLMLIDVANHNSISLLGYVATHSHGVYVVSNIAYVAGYESLKIIDVSNPKNPFLLGTVATSYAWSVYVLSNIAYVADYTAGLKIIDVSNSSAPSLVGSIATGSADGIYVVANIAYVTNSDNGFKLIDVSNPHAPSLLSSIATDNNAMGVNVVSDIAYVADSYGGLKLIDIYSTGFSGLPTCADRGSDYNITLQATDNLAKTASTSFNLEVYFGPQVTHTIGNQTVEIAKMFNLLIPKGTFIDLCDNVLTYFSQLTNNQPLPTWLTFNSTNQQFSGTPLAKEDIQVWDIAVKATDTAGKSAKTSFYLDVYNQGIKVNGNIPNQQVVTEVYFEYIFPSALFIDEDDLKLNYRAILSDGKSLPTWLQLDSASRKFYGTPANQDIGTYPIRLYAEDNYAEKSVDFEITVYSTHQPPSVNKGIPAQGANVGRYFSYTIPDDTFNNPNNDKLTYKAFLGGGKPLPSWLLFVPEIKTFSGSPKSEETLSVVVTVTDSCDASAQTAFSLNCVNQTLRMLKTFVSIGGPILTALGLLITAYAKRSNISNHFKKKQYQLSDQSIVLGKTWNHNVDESKVDQVKDVRLFKIKKQNWKEASLSDYVSSWWNNHLEEPPAAQLLPPWLKYNFTLGTLTAIPSEMHEKDAGDYEVVFSDKKKYRLEEFTLHVTNAEQSAVAINVATDDVELANPLGEPGRSSMQVPLLKSSNK